MILKATNNMPHIEQLSANSFRIEVSTGYDANGKKLRKRKTIKLDEGLTEKQRKKELDTQTALFEREVQNGTYLNGDKITFAEFADIWLVDYAEKQLAPKTVAEYKKLLTRVVPAIGHLKISKLQPAQLNELYNNLSESGMRLDNRYCLNPKYTDILKSNRAELPVNQKTAISIIKGNPTTYSVARRLCECLRVQLNELFSVKVKSEKLSGNSINHYHRLISSILTAAVQNQLILSNPAQRVKPPKIGKKEAAHYDDDTAIKLFELLSSEPLKYQAAVYIAIFGGLRLEEVTGLNWSDIDFDKKTIDINKTSQYITGMGIIEGQTKTEKSARNITISDAVINILKAYRLEQQKERLKLADLWIETGKIFVQWNGKPMFPSTPSSWFHKWLKKSGLPALKFHDLRHTNASLLISQGVDVALVSKRLGHSQITTTLNIYTHAINKYDAGAAQVLDELLKK